MQGGREVVSEVVPVGYVVASDERPTPQMGRYERPSAASVGGGALVVDAGVTADGAEARR